MIGAYEFVDRRHLAKQRRKIRGLLYAQIAKGEYLLTALREPAEKANDWYRETWDLITVAFGAGEAHVFTTRRPAVNEYAEVSKHLEMVERALANLSDLDQRLDQVRPLHKFKAKKWRSGGSGV